MKLRSFYLLFTFLPFIPFHPTEYVWMRDNYTKIEQYISMRDGIKLFTSIYIPKNKSEKHPILFTRTPYSCAPYGNTEFYPGQWPSYWKYYCRENYILVRQDVRGRWMSEGEFVDVRPFIKNKKQDSDIDEASDAYDTIDWLIKNLPGNNGNVGIFGSSYPGFYSAMAAVCGHSALKAASPQAPVTDWFMGDDFHHNGAFFAMDAFGFFSSFGKPRPRPTSVAAKGFHFPGNDLYQFYLKSGPLKKLNELIGDSIKFWNEMYAHPNYDEWWQARDARSAMYNIKLPVLIVGGLFDAEDCYGTWNLYKAIEKQNPGINNKIVIGPWSHGQWAETDGGSLGNVQFGTNTATWYQANIEIPFFNYYLKGKKDDPKLPEATIFFSGENQWRKFDKWPPDEVSSQLIFLSNSGSLTWNKSTDTQKFSEYISDPANPVPYMKEIKGEHQKQYMVDDQSFASTRKDVLTFQTLVLDKDLVLAGPVTADLKVSTSGTDADFVVKLIDVFPGGIKDKGDGDETKVNYQMLVRGEIMRGKYRNSFEKPEPFIPDSIATVKFEMPDIAHAFKKGHRLMIQIQSSWFPLADRNPQKFLNIYKAEENDFQKAVVRIYHDAINSSNIILPVFK